MGLTIYSSYVSVIMISHLVNLSSESGDYHLRITYASKRVEKYFSDYREMQKAIGLDWTRTVKKHIERLKAAECFGDFLKVGLGHPEPLSGKDAGKWSLHISGNVRLVFRLDGTGDAVFICEEIVMEGVVDYHGSSSDTWYIP